MSLMIQEMVTLLEAGTSFVLATVVTSNGSAPRTTGAQMIVHHDGSIAGTIGGGRLEADVLKLARDIFVRPQRILREFEFSGKDAAAMDMICGGRQEILIEYIDAHDRPLGEICAAALQTVRARQKGWWINALPGAETPPFEHCLIRADGTLVGDTAGQLTLVDDHTDAGRTLHLAGQVIALDNVRAPRLVTAAGQRFTIEPLDVYGSVYIFGAGHVSQKVAALAKTVGFHTLVLDDRAEFANRQRFETVDEIIVPASMPEAFDALEIDANSYLVIVTRGHLHDQIVLEKALNSQAGYIGMIGSKRKRELIYQDLESKGYPRHRLEQIYSPIGLPIGADSPEEIAVSIVAELIQVRSRRHGGH